MLLLVKLKNAAELFWESLDEQERIMLLYAGCSLMLTLAGSVAERRRQRQRTQTLELLEELGVLSHA